MTQQENHANADKLSIQKIIFFVNDSVSIRQEATFCVERWREKNVFCTERESFGFSGKCFTGRRCSLLTDKREPERTAVPAGHESPSGAFKPQTGLRSKCRVFSAARSQRFRRAGPDGLRHPASASCLGRHSHPAGRCPNSSSLHPPLAAVVAVALFSRFSDLKAPQPLRRQLPAGEPGAPSPSLSVTPCPLFVAARHLPPTGGSLSKGEARSTPIMPLAPPSGELARSA